MTQHLGEHLPRRLDLGATVAVLLDDRRVDAHGHFIDEQAVAHRAVVDEALDTVAEGDHALAPLLQHDHLDAHLGGDVGQAESRHLAPARPGITEEYRLARVHTLDGAQAIELVRVGRQRRPRRHCRHHQRGDHSCDRRQRVPRDLDRLAQGFADEEDADDQAREAANPAKLTLGERQPDAGRRDRQADEGDDEPQKVVREKGDHHDDESGRRQQRQDGERSTAH